ncbi:pentapeptide repeat-containing protein [Streptomyces sp. NPDC057539]|uniref:pentapeptide repeat-containing protein n=1 Tax=Streptomyces sp. NPDC057539 TaxID=3346159 RepID=UPI00369207DA
MDWARRIELGTVAAAVAVAGLWYSNVQTQQTNEQMRQANEQARQASAQAREDRPLAKEGQITDRYTAAVENLGADKMDVRLGGIYALQRIMKDSPRDQPTIGNVLAAYIRTHAVRLPAEGQGVPADVHAGLTVLATRDTDRDTDFYLDLRLARLPGVELASAQGAALSGANLTDADLTNTDLRRADLSGADLAEVNLSDAMLYEADLSPVNLANANLTNAVLAGVNLSDASLVDANLAGASLSNVDLSGANLSGANLSGLDFSSVDLYDADLRGADLTDARNLAKVQVNSARTDETTQLPPGLS